MTKLEMPFLQGLQPDCVVEMDAICLATQLGWEISRNFLYMPAAKRVHLQHMLKGYHVLA